MCQVRIAGGWLYRMRRVLATLLIGILAGLVGYKVVFGANGMVVYRGKRAEYQRLQRDIEHEIEEQARLQRQVELLRSDPKTIEKEAREQLGYVRRGEVVLVEPQPRLDAKLPPAQAQAK
jgi:cell division protein FtsB